MRVLLQLIVRVDVSTGWLVEDGLRWCEIINQASQWISRQGRPLIAAYTKMAATCYGVAKPPPISLVKYEIAMHPNRGGYGEKQKKTNIGWLCLSNITCWEGRGYPQKNVESIWKPGWRIRERVDLFATPCHFGRWGGNDSAAWFLSQPVMVSSSSRLTRDLFFLCFSYLSFCSFFFFFLRWFFFSVFLFSCSDYFLSYFQILFLYLLVFKLKLFTYLIT